MNLGSRWKDTIQLLQLVGDTNGRSVSRWLLRAGGRPSTSIYFYYEILWRPRATPELFGVVLWHLGGYFIALSGVYVPDSPHHGMNHMEGPDKNWYALLILLWFDDCPYSAAPCGFP